MKNSDVNSQKIQDLMDVIISRQEMEFEVEVVENPEKKDKNKLTDLVQVISKLPQDNNPVITDTSQPRQVTNADGDKITLNL